jgi:hypothetical protein
MAALAALAHHRGAALGAGKSMRLRLRNVGEAPMLCR